MNPNIGSNIRRYRKEANLKVTELAHKCGLTQPQITRLEANDQGLRSQTAFKIAKALGIKVWVLFMTIAEVEAVKPYVDIYAKKTFFG